MPDANADLTAFSNALAEATAKAAARVVTVEGGRPVGRQRRALAHRPRGHGA